jgi:hypothetical protein
MEDLRTTFEEIAEGAGTLQSHRAGAMLAE